MAYDEKNGIHFMGTYQNKLMAYKDGEKIWELEAKGPFCRLVLCEADGYLYAGNEDTHIYVVNPQDGLLVRDISFQRRINDIDVKKDGSEIVVSSSAGKMKHYLTFLDQEGNEVKSEKLASKVPVLAYTANDDGVVLANTRGEVQVADADGNQKAQYKGKYASVDLEVDEDGKCYLVLLNDTTYVLLDENLNLIQEGKPAKNAEVTPTCVYKDSLDNIYIGTKEKYLYVMNKDGGTVFESRLDGAISDFVEENEKIYITGLGDWLYTLDINNLVRSGSASKIQPIVKVLLPLFIALTIFSALMSFDKTHDKMIKGGKSIVRHRLAYILLLPTFILLILFNYVPVFMAFTRAFTNWSKDAYHMSQIKWIGLDNFRTMISEGYFLTGLGNLAILLIAGLAKVLTVPVLVAYLVYSMRSNKKKYAFRFLFVLPMVVPSVVTALLWKQIYDPTIGLINQLLGKVGLESWQHVWLGDPKTALASIIFMGFPFINALAFLVFYGGFLDIDTSMLEAARADGAGRWKIFWRIQIPQIAPQIKMIVILNFIGIIQDFTPIYLLTSGGPGRSTYVPGLELYYNATQFGRYGYACALGLVMFIFILVPTVINMRSKKDF